MELKQRQSLQKALRSLPLDRPARLILQSQAAPEFYHAPPTPDQFQTRLEFRRALIDYECASDHSSVEALAVRLRGLGLTVRVASHSGTVVVQGKPALLAQALDDNGIESADFDRKIELIKPSGRSQDQNR